MFTPYKNQEIFRQIFDEPNQFSWKHWSITDFVRLRQQKHWIMSHDVHKIRWLDSCWNLSHRYIRRQLWHTTICRFLIIQISIIKNRQIVVCQSCRRMCICLTNFNNQKPTNKYFKGSGFCHLTFLFPQFVLWSNFFKRQSFSRRGTSINDVRRFLAFFDLPTYPCPISSDFEKGTYLMTSDFDWPT